MATRIDIELTSAQDDGKTFTWRAAGARQPKGAASADLFPEGAKVGDEFKVETEMSLDGIEVTAVVPPKAKDDRGSIERLELLGSGDETPLVTQQLASKRGDRRDRKGGRRGDRKSSGRKGDGGGRPERPRTPAKPKLPPKPKPPRLKAGKAHRNELLAQLPDEERAVAEELVRGGLQAVRQGLAKQNEQRKVEGADPIDETPIVTLAERLLLKVRAAEWLDRAEAALEQADTVDLRDLRSVVTAADGAAKDDESRSLAAKLRTALNDRLEADHQAWIQEVVDMLDDDRVVRALHLSSRPPKAGSPLPAPVAMRLVEAANAAMNAETAPDRWGYILDALAHSPVRRQVVPVGLPTRVTTELKATIARHGSRLPEIAQIFGVEPDSKAGRGPRRKKVKKAKGKAGAEAKPQDAEATSGDAPKATAESEAAEKAPVSEAPQTEDAPTAPRPAAEAPQTEDTPTAPRPAAEAPQTEDTPKSEEPAS